MGQLRADLQDLTDNGSIGDWCFRDHETEGLHICIRFPDGSERGDLGCLPLRDVPDPSMEDWQWDGNKEAPTLTPSINYVGVWHGYMRAGRLESV